MDLIQATAVANGVDILLIQEPTKSRINGPEWLVDNRKDAVIKKINHDIQFFRSQAGEGYVLAELETCILYSTYVSPNITIDEYIVYLQRLAMSISEQRKPCIIGGDFNSKSYLWGSPTTNARGEILLEWLAGLDLTIANLGNVPTFVRGESESHIDLTVSSESILRKVVNWKVLVEETLSSHRYISFEIVPAERTQIPTGSPNRFKGWCVDPNLLPKFVETFGTMADTWKECIQRDLKPESLTRIIKEACNVTFKKKSSSTKYKKVYWWNKEISNARKNCNSSRRKMKRSRRRDPTLAEAAMLEYRNMKEILKSQISKAKESKWKELVEEVDKDPWGKGYKIVTGKVGHRTPINLTQEEEVQVAKELFPSDELRERATFEVNTDDIPPVLPAEVFKAAKKMKGKKAPGIDLINPEIIKAVASNFPEWVAEAFNSVLASGEIPAMWKTAKLILMEKKTSDTNARKKYRPLCMLNCLGKLFEGVIVYRLSTELEEKAPLSSNQYGFVAGKSTIDAMKAIKDKVDQNMRKHRRSRKYQLLTTIDIKNAFNTASWKWINQELEKKQISPYLRRLIDSYLHDRSIVVGKDEEKLQCSRGVPQGSVLGPTLWNVLYDKILKISLPDGVTVVGYADDTAILTEAKLEQDLKWKTNMALVQVIEAIKERELTIAAQKTEAVLLYGGRKLKTTFIEVEGERIQTTEYLKYLGVTIERNFRMGLHIKTVTRKGTNVANCLARIMPNTRGPAENRRKLLRSVVLSCILYATPIWKDALKYKIHQDTLRKGCRTACLRVCRGYRTISYEALGVISGMMPIDLLVVMRTDNSEEVRDQSLAIWQRRWTQTTKGVWTQTLIPLIDPWINRRHGFLSFELTQFLSGHGKFGSYLKRFRIIEDEDCANCKIPDTPEHTFFHCALFAEERRTLEESLGSFNVGNAVQKMLESQSNWDIIDVYIKFVIGRKREVTNGN